MEGDLYQLYPISKVPFNHTVISISINKLYFIATAQTKDEIINLIKETIPIPTPSNVYAFLSAPSDHPHHQPFMSSESYRALGFLCEAVTTFLTTFSQQEDLDVVTHLFLLLGDLSHNPASAQYLFDGTIGSDTGMYHDDDDDEPDIPMLLSPKSIATISSSAPSVTSPVVPMHGAQPYSVSGSLATGGTDYMSQSLHPADLNQGVNSLQKELIIRTNFIRTVGETIKPLLTLSKAMIQSLVMHKSSHMVTGTAYWFFSNLLKPYRFTRSGTGGDENAGSLSQSSSSSAVNTSTKSGTSHDMSDGHSSAHHHSSRDASTLATHTSPKSIHTSTKYSDEQFILAAFLLKSNIVSLCLDSIDIHGSDNTYVIEYTIDLLLSFHELLLSIPQDAVYLHAIDWPTSVITTDTSSFSNQPLFTRDTMLKDELLETFYTSFTNDNGIERLIVMLMKQTDPHRQIRRDQRSRSRSLHRDGTPAHSSSSSERPRSHDHEHDDGRDHERERDASLLQYGPIQNLCDLTYENSQYYYYYHQCQTPSWLLIEWTLSLILLLTSHGFSDSVLYQRLHHHTSTTDIHVNTQKQLHLISTIADHIRHGASKRLSVVMMNKIHEVIVRCCHFYFVGLVLSQPFIPLTLTSDASRQQQQGRNQSTTAFISSPDLTYPLLDDIALTMQQDLEKHHQQHPSPTSPATGTSELKSLATKMFKSIGSYTNTLLWNDDPNHPSTGGNSDAPGGDSHHRKGGNAQDDSIESSLAAILTYVSSSPLDMILPQSHTSTPTAHNNDKFNEIYHYYRHINADDQTYEITKPRSDGTSSHQSMDRIGPSHPLYHNTVRNHSLYPHIYKVVHPIIPSMVFEQNHALSFPFTSSIFQHYLTNCRVQDIYQSLYAMKKMLILIDALLSADLTGTYQPGSESMREASRSRTNQGSFSSKRSYSSKASLSSRVSSMDRFGTTSIPDASSAGDHDDDDFEDGDDDDFVAIPSDMGQDNIGLDPHRDVFTFESKRSLVLVVIALLQSSISLKQNGLFVGFSECLTTVSIDTMKAIRDFVDVIALDCVSILMNISTSIGFTDYLRYRNMTALAYAYQRFHHVASEAAPATTLGGVQINYSLENYLNFVVYKNQPSSTTPTTTTGGGATSTATGGRGRSNSMSSTGPSWPATPSMGVRKPDDDSSRVLTFVPIRCLSESATTFLQSPSQIASMADRQMFHEFFDEMALHKLLSDVLPLFASLLLQTFSNNITIVYNSIRLLDNYHLSLYSTMPHQYHNHNSFYELYTVLQSQENNMCAIDVQNRIPVDKSRSLRLQHSRRMGLAQGVDGVPEAGSMMSTTPHAGEIPTTSRSSVSSHRRGFSFSDRMGSAGTGLDTGNTMPLLPSFLVPTHELDAIPDHHPFSPSHSLEWLLQLQTLQVTSIVPHIVNSLVKYPSFFSLIYTSTGLLSRLLKNSKIHLMSALGSNLVPSIYLITELWLSLQSNYVIKYASSLALWHREYIIRRKNSVNCTVSHMVPSVGQMTSSSGFGKLGQFLVGYTPDWSYNVQMYDDVSKRALDSVSPDVLRACEYSMSAVNGDGSDDIGSDPILSAFGSRTSEGPSGLQQGLPSDKNSNSKQQQQQQQQVALQSQTLVPLSDQQSLYRIASTLYPYIESIPLPALGLRVIEILSTVMFFSEEYMSDSPSFDSIRTAATHDSAGTANIQESTAVPARPSSASSSQASTSRIVDRRMIIDVPLLLPSLVSRSPHDLSDSYKGYLQRAYPQCDSTIITAAVEQCIAPQPTHHSSTTTAASDTSNSIFQQGLSINLDQLPSIDSIPTLAIHSSEASLSSPSGFGFQNPLAASLSSIAGSSLLFAHLHVQASHALPASIRPSLVSPQKDYPIDSPHQRDRKVSLVGPSSGHQQHTSSRAFPTMAAASTQTQTLGQSSSHTLHVSPQPYQQQQPVRLDAAVLDTCRQLSTPQSLPTLLLAVPSHASTLSAYMCTFNHTVNLYSFHSINPMSARHSQCEGQDDTQQPSEVLSPHSMVRYTIGVDTCMLMTSTCSGMVSLLYTLMKRFASNSPILLGSLDLLTRLFALTSSEAFVSANRQKQPGQQPSLGSSVGNITPYTGAINAPSPALSSRSAVANTNSESDLVIVESNPTRSLNYRDANTMKVIDNKMFVFPSLGQVMTSWHAEITYTGMRLSDRPMRAQLDYLLQQQQQQQDQQQRQQEDDSKSLTPLTQTKPSIRLGHPLQAEQGDRAGAPVRPSTTYKPLLVNSLLPSLLYDYVVGQCGHAGSPSAESAHGLSASLPESPPGVVHPTDTDHTSHHLPFVWSLSYDLCASYSSHPPRGKGGTQGELTHSQHVSIMDTLQQVYNENKGQRKKSKKNYTLQDAHIPMFNTMLPHQHFTTTSHLAISPVELFTHLLAGKTDPLKKAIQQAGLVYLDKSTATHFPQGSFASKGTPSPLKSGAVGNSGYNNPYIHTSYGGVHGAGSAIGSTSGGGQDTLTRPRSGSTYDTTSSFSILSAPQTNSNSQQQSLQYQFHVFDPLMMLGLAPSRQQWIIDGIYHYYYRIHEVNLFCIDSNVSLTTLVNAVLHQVPYYQLADYTSSLHLHRPPPTLLPPSGVTPLILPMSSLDTTSSSSGPHTSLRRDGSVFQSSSRVGPGARLQPNVALSINPTLVGPSGGQNVPPAPTPLATPSSSNNPFKFLKMKIDTTFNRKDSLTTTNSELVASGGAGNPYREKPHGVPAPSGAAALATPSNSNALNNPPMTPLPPQTPLFLNQAGFGGASTNGSSDSSGLYQSSSAQSITTATAPSSTISYDHFQLILLHLASSDYGNANILVSPMQFMNHRLLAMALLSQYNNQHSSLSGFYLSHHVSDYTRSQEADPLGGDEDDDDDESTRLTANAIDQNARLYYLSQDIFSTIIAITKFTGLFFHILSTHLSVFAIQELQHKRFAQQLPLEPSSAIILALGKSMTRRSSLLQDKTATNRCMGALLLSIHTAKELTRQVTQVLAITKQTNEPIVKVTPPPADEYHDISEDDSQEDLLYDPYDSPDGGVATHFSLSNDSAVGLGPSTSHFTPTNQRISRRQDSYGPQSFGHGPLQRDTTQQSLVQKEQNAATSSPSPLTAHTATGASPAMLGETDRGNANPSSKPFTDPCHVPQFGNLSYTIAIPLHRLVHTSLNLGKLVNSNDPASILSLTILRSSRSHCERLHQALTQRNFELIHAMDQLKYVLSLNILSSALASRLRRAISHNQHNFGTKANVSDMKRFIEQKYATRTRTPMSRVDESTSSTGKGSSLRERRLRNRSLRGVDIPTQASTQPPQQQSSSSSGTKSTQTRSRSSILSQFDSMNSVIDAFSKTGHADLPLPQQQDSSVSSDPETKDGKTETGFMLNAKGLTLHAHGVHDKVSPASSRNGSVFVDDSYDLSTFLDDDSSPTPTRPSPSSRTCGSSHTDQDQDGFVEINTEEFTLNASFNESTMPSAIKQLQAGADISPSAKSTGSSPRHAHPQHVHFITETDRSDSSIDDIIPTPLEDSGLANIPKLVRPSSTLSGQFRSGAMLTVQIIPSTYVLSIGVGASVSLSGTHPRSSSSYSQQQQQQQTIAIDSVDLGNDAIASLLLSAFSSSITSSNQHMASILSLSTSLLLFQSVTSPILNPILLQRLDADRKVQLQPDVTIPISCTETTRLTNVPTSFTYSTQNAYYLLNYFYLSHARKLEELNSIFDYNTQESNLSSPKSQPQVTVEISPFPPYVAIAKPAADTATKPSLPTSKTALWLNAVQTDPYQQLLALPIISTNGNVSEFIIPHISRLRNIDRVTPQLLYYFEHHLHIVGKLTLHSPQGTQSSISTSHNQKRTTARSQLHHKNLPMPTSSLSQERASGEDSVVIVPDPMQSSSSISMNKITSGEPQSTLPDGPSNTHHHPRTGDPFATPVKQPARKSSHDYLSAFRVDSDISDVPTTLQPSAMGYSPSQGTSSSLSTTSSTSSAPVMMTFSPATQKRSFGLLPVVGFAPPQHPYGSGGGGSGANSHSFTPYQRQLSVTNLLTSEVGSESIMSMNGGGGHDGSGSKSLVPFGHGPGGVPHPQSGSGSFSVASALPPLLSYRRHLLYDNAAYRTYISTVHRYASSTIILSSIATYTTFAPIELLSSSSRIHDSEMTSKSVMYGLTTIPVAHPLTLRQVDFAQMASFTYDPQFCCVDYHGLKKQLLRENAQFHLHGTRRGPRRQVEPCRLELICGNAPFCEHHDHDTKVDTAFPRRLTGKPRPTLCLSMACSSEAAWRRIFCLLEHQITQYRASLDSWERSQHAARSQADHFSFPSLPHVPPTISSLLRSHPLVFKLVSTTDGLSVPLLRNNFHFFNPQSTTNRGIVKHASGDMPHMNGEGKSLSSAFESLFDYYITVNTHYAEKSNDLLTHSMYVSYKPTPSNTTRSPASSTAVAPQKQQHPIQAYVYTYLPSPTQPTLRSLFWYNISGARDLHSRHVLNYYTSLVLLSNAKVNPYSSVKIEILKDVNRTLTSHPMFSPQPQPYCCQHTWCALYQYISSSISNQQSDDASDAQSTDIPECTCHSTDPSVQLGPDGLVPDSIPPPPTLATTTKPIHVQAAQIILNRLLSAYFIRNSDSVGYCQGMNSLMATLMTQFIDVDLSLQRWRQSNVVEYDHLADHTIRSCPRDATTATASSSSPTTSVPCGPSRHVCEHNVILTDHDVDITFAEEQVFFVFCILIESRMGYYSKSMCEMKRDQRVLSSLLHYYDGELESHLVSHGVTMDFTVSWLICLFVDNPLHFDTTLKVWDFMFIYGDYILFWVVLSILQHHREHILAISQLDEMLNFLLRLRDHIHRPDSFGDISDWLHEARIALNTMGSTPSSDTSRGDSHRDDHVEPSSSSHLSHDHSFSSKHTGNTAKAAAANDVVVYDTHGQIELVSAPVDSFLSLDHHHGVDPLPHQDGGCLQRGAVSSDMEENSDDLYCNDPTAAHGVRCDPIMRAHYHTTQTVYVDIFQSCCGHQDRISSHHPTVSPAQDTNRLAVDPSDPSTHGQGNSIGMSTGTVKLNSLQLNPSASAGQFYRTAAYRRGSLASAAAAAAMEPYTPDASPLHPSSSILRSPKSSVRPAPSHDMDDMLVGRSSGIFGIDRHSLFRDGNNSSADDTTPPHTSISLVRPGILGTPTRRKQDPGTPALNLGGNDGHAVGLSTPIIRTLAESSSSVQDIGLDVDDDLLYRFTVNLQSNQGFFTNKAFQQQQYDQPSQNRSNRSMDQLRSSLTLANAPTEHHHGRESTGSHLNSLANSLASVEPCDISVRTCIRFFDPYTIMESAPYNFSSFVAALRQQHQQDVLVESSSLQSSTSHILMRDLGLGGTTTTTGSNQSGSNSSTSCNIIERAYKSFLSPAPWAILLNSCLNNPIMFTQAFVPLVFPEWHRNCFAYPLGLHSPVFDRLFHIFDRTQSSSLNFIDFLLAVRSYTPSIATPWRCHNAQTSDQMQQVIRDRFRLCFLFCDIDNDGVISLADLTFALSILHDLYLGQNNAPFGNAILFTYLNQAQRSMPWYNHWDLDSSLDVTTAMGAHLGFDRSYQQLKTPINQPNLYPNGRAMQGLCSQTSLIASPSTSTTSRALTTVHKQYSNAMLASLFTRLMFVRSRGVDMKQSLLENTIPHEVVVDVPSISTGAPSTFLHHLSLLLSPEQLPAYQHASNPRALTNIHATWALHSPSDHTVTMKDTFLRHPLETSGLNSAYYQTHPLLSVKSHVVAQTTVRPSPYATSPQSSNVEEVQLRYHQQCLNRLSAHPSQLLNQFNYHIPSTYSSLASVNQIQNPLLPQGGVAPSIGGNPQAVGSYGTAFTSSPSAFTSGTAYNIASFPIRSTGGGSGSDDIVPDIDFFNLKSSILAGQTTTNGLSPAPHQHRVTQNVNNINTSTNALQLQPVDVDVLSILSSNNVSTHNIYAARNMNTTSTSSDFSPGMRTNIQGLYDHQRAYLCGQTPNQRHYIHFSNHVYDNNLPLALQETRHPANQLSSSFQQIPSTGLSFEEFISVCCLHPLLQLFFLLPDLTSCHVPVYDTDKADSSTSCTPQNHISVYKLMYLLQSITKHRRNNDQHRFTEPHLQSSNTFLFDSL